MNYAIQGRQRQLCKEMNILLTILHSQKSAVGKDDKKQETLMTAPRNEIEEENITFCLHKTLIYKPSSFVLKRQLVKTL